MDVAPPDLDPLGKPGVQRARDAVAAWLASGKPIDVFCHDAHLSIWTMKRWRLQYAEEFGLTIRRRPGAVGKRDRRSMAGEQVTPIELAPVMIAEPASASEVAIEIRLRGNRSLVIPATIDLQYLSRLLVAVEQAG